MLVGSSLKYEKKLWTVTRSPMRPERTISSAACQLGCSRYMNASMNFTSASAHASTMRSASTELNASGFSHRTCLPA